MRKGSHQTRETKEKMSKARIGSNNPMYGKPRTEITKKKISEANKGHIPWNKGKIGIYSEETLKKISKSAKNRPRNKWGNHTKEAKEKMRIAHLRENLSDETLKKMSEGRRGLQAGENNPNWKGGISSLMSRIRTNFKYRQWRSDIYYRDNFTCQDCGDNKGGNLEAHHIKTFSIILQYYEIATLEEALNCEELWDINNGMTLCEKCHKKMKEKVYAS